VRRAGWLDPALRGATGLAVALVALQIARARVPAAASETPIPSAGPTGSARVVSFAREAPKDRDARVTEVAIRLVDALAGAEIERPAEPDPEQALRGTWHRVRDPWVPLPADREGLAQIVSTHLRAPDGWTAPTPREGEPPFSLELMSAWAQREAIVAIAPTKLRFHVRLPPGARLEAEPAVLALGDAAPGGLCGEVRFVVSVAEPGGASREVARHTVREDARERFSPLRVDLGAFAGKEIELTLATEADARAPLGTARAVHPVALWGVPRVLAETRAPCFAYDVLFIVVDAFRPDVIAAFHDPEADAKKLAAPHPPGATLLPKVPGVVPRLEALAKQSTIFRRASSASHWTRPGTFAMLAGAFADHYGIAGSTWVVGPGDTSAFYAASPPLLPLALRRAGATARAIGNNHFLYGWDPMGLDLGFESFDGFEHEIHDTASTLGATLASLRAHAGERTFTFVNFNSPHYPMTPTRACMARLPQPENILGIDGMIAQYRAEACKDDEAIGALLDELDRTGARANTLVVVTADHGETLSFDHHAADETLFAHAIHQYEETTRVPILLSLPGVIPEGRAIDVPVTTLDLAPTILAIEGLPPDPRHHGVDLLALARPGSAAPPERPIVTLGRGSSAIQLGDFRYVSHDEPQKHLFGREELYDLTRDPGEAINLVDEPAWAGKRDALRARLRAALATWASGGATSASDPKDAPRLRVRFAGAGVRRLRAVIRAPEARALSADAIGLAPGALRVDGTTIELSGETRADALVGVDLRVTPAAADVRWTFWLDGVEVTEDEVLGGALGSARAGLSRGVAGREAREALAADVLPIVDPSGERCVFVVRDRASTGEGVAIARGANDEANAEVARALKAWGYAK
jgi:arylsulfatase A-like enzyme